MVEGETEAVGEALEIAVEEVAAAVATITRRCTASRLAEETSSRNHVEMAVRFTLAI